MIQAVDVGSIEVDDNITSALSITDVGHEEGVAKEREKKNENKN